MNRKQKEKHLEDRMVRAIQDHVGWFNGWSCSEAEEEDSVRKGLRKALKILSRHQSPLMVARDVRSLISAISSRRRPHG